MDDEGAIDRVRRMAATADGRRRLERAGLHVLGVDYHAPIPTLAEIEASFELQDGAAPFAAPSLFDAPAMARALDEFALSARDWRPPADGDRRAPAGYFWDNPMFRGADALAYYAMLRRVRPRTVIEVGCGFSSLVALEALRDNGAGRLICVEPYPRPFLRDRSGQLELIERPAEALPPAWFADRLSAGDVLFIDSTHTLRSGGDCVHLLLRVLPALRPRLTVHVHDVFLPLGYPRLWLEQRRWFWTEQYALHALLLGVASARVLFGTVWHRVADPAGLDRFMDGRWHAEGSSFWFEWSGLERAGAAEISEANVRAYVESVERPPLCFSGADPHAPAARPPRPRGRAFDACDFDAAAGVTRAAGRLEALDDGDWVRYARVDFGDGATRATLRLAVSDANAGQRIELRIGRLDAAPASTLTIAPTGGWERFSDQGVDLPPTRGVHDLFLVVRGGYGAGNLASIRIE